MAAQPLPTSESLVAPLDELLDCGLDHVRPQLDPARGPDGR
jgi:hypothetical protein